MGATGNWAGGAAGRKATAVRCVKLLYLLTTVSTLGNVVSSAAFTAHRCLDHLEGVSPFKSPENTQTTCWESLLSTRVQVCSCSPEEIQLLHHYPEFSPPWHCGADRQARVKGLLPSWSVKDGSNAGFLFRFSLLRPGYKHGCPCNYKLPPQHMPPLWVLF